MVFVSIINDILFEDSETFFGHLSAGGVLPPNVRLAPIEVIATIIDDDRELNTNVLQIIIELELVINPWRMCKCYGSRSVCLLPR